MKSRFNILTLTTIAFFTITLFLTPVIVLAKFPEKPIKILVANPPGGGTDQSLRPLEPFFPKFVGTNLVFSYKVGGGGELGWSEFMKSRNDGYSIVSLTLPHYIIQPLIKDVGYDFEKIIPLFSIARDVGAVIVHKDSKWNTFKELLEDANKRPQKISVALSPPNGPHHLHLLKIQDAMSFPVSTVAYTGGNDSKKDFLGRHFDVWIMNTDIALAVKENARFLALADIERKPEIPDTPTFRELGYDIVQYTIRGVGGLRGMPEIAKTTIVDGVKEIFKDQIFIDSLKKLTIEPYFLEAKEFEKYMLNETEATRRLFKKYNLLKKP